MTTTLRKPGHAAERAHASAARSSYMMDRTNPRTPQKQTDYEMPDQRGEHSGWLLHYKLQCLSRNSRPPRTLPGTAVTAAAVRLRAKKGTAAFLVSIVDSISACHAEDRGSIPRRGGLPFPQSLYRLPKETTVTPRRQHRKRVQEMKRLAFLVKIASSRHVPLCALPYTWRGFVTL